MWDPQEFEQHWRAEFPGEPAPVMCLGSVHEVEQELERCRSQLKKLQQVLAEERFKVIYLETTLARGHHRPPGTPELPVPRARFKPPPPPPPPRVRGAGPPGIRPAPTGDRDFEDEEGGTERFVLGNLLVPGESREDEEERGTLHRGHRLQIPGGSSPRHSSPERGSDVSSDREDSFAD
ncbi:hypothetical protein FKM82_008307 [Ascaphus truei]